MDPRILSYLPLVSPVATLVVVVLGVFFSNRHVDVRISDLQRYIDVRIGAVDAKIDAKISALDARISAEARVNEANFKMLLGKIEDIDTRLTRLEERFSH